MSRYDIADPKCQHKRRGIVTSHPGVLMPPRGEPHAAANCCGREACVEDGLEWVRAVTGGRSGAYVADGDAR